LRPAKHDYAIDPAALDESTGAPPTTTPIRRFDPEWLLAEVNERARLELALIGTAEVGESGGAVYVAWPDGRDGVITGSVATSAADLRRTADVLALARSRGLPVPRYDLVVEISDGIVALVQERLPGMPMTDATNLDATQTLISVNEQFANLLFDRPDVPVPAMNLRHSGPALPRFGIDDDGWHETMERYSDRSRRLIARIQEIGATEPHEMVGNDLLPTDLNEDNILRDQNGTVTGIVDWNWGVARGDRRSTLVKVRMGMAWAMLDPDPGQDFYDARDYLDAHLESTLDPTLLRMYFAHWALHMISWSILHRPAEVIDVFLQLAESKLY
jgi:aminoglycoside phosphotransferase (APT) family kinase protein